MHPYILYCIEVYGNTYISYMDKLTKLNNKLLRVLQKKGHSCCNECLYVQYNTLPPVQLFNYQVINLVHKTLFTPYLLPPIFQQYFSLNKSLHSYNTRNQKIQFSQHQTHLGYHTVRFKGSGNRRPVHWWNSYSRSFKVMHLEITEKPMRHCIPPIITLTLSISKVSEEIIAENADTFRHQQHHWRLTPSPRNPVNIRIHLMFPETWANGLNFCRW